MVNEIFRLSTAPESDKGTERLSLSFHGRTEALRHNTRISILQGCWESVTVTPSPFQPSQMQKSALQPCECTVMGHQLSSNLLFHLGETIPFPYNPDVCLVCWQALRRNSGRHRVWERTKHCFMWERTLLKKEVDKKSCDCEGNISPATNRCLNLGVT